MKDSCSSPELKSVEPLHRAGNQANPESGRELRARLEYHLEGDPLGPERPPPAIPEFKLLERIGIGAYGEVWLGQSSLGTLRAVKVVYRDRYEDERPYQREFNGILNYEPVSRAHEGLIAVLHAGCNEERGYFYYVMEVADNEAAVDSVGLPPLTRPGRVPYQPATLRHRLARLKRLDPAETARLGIVLAGALAHLHTNDLVHRDIKPSNVIFVGGKPKLADLGLVTGTGDTRSFVGTEGFIPPEGPGTSRADIFALGKLLYEACTGRDRLEFPQLPPELLAGPNRDALLEINEVITRACAPDPARRYASAGEMIADLTLMLSGRSLREEGQLRTRLRWFKRIALSAGLVCLLAVVAAWGARVAELNARNRAETEAALRYRAEAAEREVISQLHTALSEHARANVRSGEMGQRVRTLAAIQRAGAISNAPGLRREAIAALAVPDLRLQQTIPIPFTESTVARLDHTLERLAICRSTGPVEIRSTRDQRLLACLPATAELPPVYTIWSPDNRYLAVKRASSATNGARLEVWDTISARAVVVDDDPTLELMTFHPRLPVVMNSTKSGALTVRNLQSGEVTARLQVSENARLLAFAPTGDQFAVSHRNGRSTTLSLHSFPEGVPIRSHSVPDLIAAQSWSPNGRWIAAAGFGGSIFLIDLERGDWRKLGQHKLQAVWATFADGNRYLFTGGWEREIICWDLSTMEPALKIGMESFTVQFDPTGQHCALIAREGIHLCDFESTSSIRDLAAELGGRIYQAEFSPDGRWLAVSGSEKLGLWDTRSDGPGVVLPQGGDSWVRFSPDSRKILTSRDDGSWVWELGPAPHPGAPPAATPLNVFRVNGFNSLCTTVSNAILTCASGSRLLPLDDLASDTGTWFPTISGVNGTSPDGRFFAVFTPFTPRLHVYSLPQFEPLVIITNPVNVREFEFTSGGRQLRISSTTGVRTWDTDTWQLTHQLTNSMRAIFSPDGRTAWLTKDFHTAGLFGRAGQEPLLPLPPGVIPLALSPDGKHLAVSHNARRVQLWHLPGLLQDLHALGVSPGILAEAPKPTRGL